MTWFGWTVIGLYVVSTLCTIAMVGEDREPLSPNMAALTTLLNGLLILGALHVGTGHL